MNLLKKLICRFVPIASSPLRGIIHLLPSECCGNIHDRGVVTITADRPYSDSPCYAAENIADLEANSYFNCANMSDMWVRYDFNNMKVILTDYSIRSWYDHTLGNLRS
jgi:hypothetical protein